MTREEEIFDAFIKANGIEVKPDFQSGKKVYTGLMEKSLTREELCGTQDYAGFVDGYEGRPNRFKGAKGSPERGSIKKSIESSLEEIPPHDNAISTLLGSIGIISAFESARYNQQYRLGSSSKTL